MTDNEIIKSMQCVIGKEMLCSECTYQKVLPFPSCRRMCAKNAIDLINRQRDEIERLQKKANTPFAKVTFDENKLKEIVSDVAKNIEFNLNSVKSEAIKEFAKELKNCFAISGDYLDIINIIDNLVKEMTEV